MINFPNIYIYFSFFKQSMFEPNFKFLKFRLGEGF